MIRPMDRDEVARQLNSASVEIRKKQESLATVLCSENEARAQVFSSELSKGTSVAASEKLAEIHTQHIVTQRLKLRGEIIVLEEELNHLRFMVKWNLTDAL